MENSDDIEIEETGRKGEKKTKEKKTEKILRRSEKARKYPERYLLHTFLTYKEAISGADTNKWIEVIEREKESIEKK